MATTDSLTGTISQVLQMATKALAAAPHVIPRLEAEVLLASVLDKPRSHLAAWPENRLLRRQLEQFHALIQRRLNGEPSAYLTGHREFWSLSLMVTPETLIPRPETELLVERALELIPPLAEYAIADLGTGCGAIAAALAGERPASTILATDRSLEALAVANGNFRSLGLKNVRSVSGHWCRALPEGSRFDLILSNPPYVAQDDPHLLTNGLPWEPASALVSGRDGLDDIRLIVDQAAGYLKPGGWLLLEHGFDQGSEVARLLAEHGYRHCRTLCDLAGIDRVSEGRYAAG